MLHRLKSSMGIWERLASRHANATAEKGNYRSFARRPWGRIQSRRALDCGPSVMDIQTPQINPPLQITQFGAEQKKINFYFFLPCLELSLNFFFEIGIRLDAN